jgi:O-antigen/teichoic acid export membrane protein
MSLKRNTLYNLLGSIAPMLVGMITVPAYLHIIGADRYGVLALVWLFLGYFGLFDPGITRAATFHIARLGNPGQEKDRESVFWTALALNTAFGLAGGIAVYFAARPIFMSTFKMPQEMRGEVMACLPWLAASIPVSIVTAVLGGTLQAREKFGVFNTINVVNAVLSQLVPLSVAYFHGPDLRWLIPTVLITRSVGAIPTCIVLIRALPIGRGGRFSKSFVKDLFIYGGWITVTNLLNPLLTTMDRMLIGSLLSAQAVAFYTVPYNLVSRVSVIPGALVTSLFPRLSRAVGEESAQLASDSVVALAAIMTPIVVLGMGAFHIFMRFWVGAHFADNAATAGVILLVGIWINGLAFIPQGHLQAIERPDVVAKFHAIELVPFLGLLWVGLHFFGLIGAAWAWTLRVTLDGMLLFLVAGRIPKWYKILPGGVLVLAASAFVPTQIVSFRTIIELVLLGAALVWSWNVSPLVRAVVQRQFKMRQAPQIA